jgi:MoxR-like ATPase
LKKAVDHPKRHYLIFLDEFNRCREMARNGIMPALDSTRKIFNPLDGRTLDIPDNVTWIAAINNGNQFTGTTTVDPAQLDRFAPLKTDYPPEREEVKILQRRFPEVPIEQIKLVVGAANAVRKDEKLQTDLSMRATEEVCTLLAHPNFLEGPNVVPELLRSSYAGRFVGNPEDSASDAGMVWAVLKGYLEREGYSV